VRSKERNSHAGTRRKKKQGALDKRGGGKGRPPVFYERGEHNTTRVLEFIKSRGRGNSHFLAKGKGKGLLSRGERRVFDKGGEDSVKKKRGEGSFHSMLSSSKAVVQRKKKGNPS